MLLKQNKVINNIQMNRLKLNFRNIHCLDYAYFASKFMLKAK